MVKIVKYGMIAFMVVAALVVGFMAFGWYTIDDPNTPSDKKQKAEVEEVSTANTDEEAINDPSGGAPPTEERVPAADVMVAKEHEIMNDLVGYGNDYEFDFYSESNKEYLQLVRDEIQQQAEHVDDENLKLDFENVVKLIDLGTKKEDVESLDYAHRILHDLDMKMNNYVGRATDVHRFGYSRYDNGEQASNVDHKLQDAQ